MLLVRGEYGELKLIPEVFRAFNRARSVSSTEEGPSPMAGHFFFIYDSWSASSDEAPCLFWDSRKATLYRVDSQVRSRVSRYPYMTRCIMCQMYI